MNNSIKNALDKITAEEDLITKTQKYLQDTLAGEKPEKPSRSQPRPFARKLVLAACLLIVFGLTATGYSFYKTPDSYVCLDINPSIEIVINRFDRVISAEGYNQDGSIILSDEQIANKSVKEAVRMLIASALEKGYIEQDGSTVIALTSETDNQEKAAALIEAAKEGTDEALAQNGDSAVVYTDNVALQRREEARNLGLTPGKLNLIEKLQKLNPDITVEEFKEAKVKEIMKKMNELKNDNKQTDSQNSENASGKGNTGNGNAGSGSDTQAPQGPGQEAGNSNASGYQSQNGGDKGNTASGQQTENQKQLKDQFQNNGEDTQIREQNEIQNQETENQKQLKDQLQNNGEDTQIREQNEIQNQEQVQSSTENPAGSGQNKQSEGSLESLSDSGNGLNQDNPDNTKDSSANKKS